MIIIASDHAGYEMKENIKSFLIKNNYELEDLGTYSKDSVDYPKYAFELGNSIAGTNNLGILVCGTGIGMSIACNKVKGIRCAKVSDELEAKLCKEHNNANVIALSSRLDKELVYKIITKYIETPFSKEERHIRRLNQIENYECQ